MKKYPGYYELPDELIAEFQRCYEMHKEPIKVVDGPSEITTLSIVQKMKKYPGYYYIFTQHEDRLWSMCKRIREIYGLNARVVKNKHANVFHLQIIESRDVVAWNLVDVYEEGDWYSRETV